MLTVIVEDGNLHDAGPAKLHLPVVVSGEKRQLEEKLLVRLPLVVIHNCDPDLLLSLLGLKSEHLVHGLVVLALHGATVNGLDLHLARVPQVPVAANQNFEGTNILHHGR